MPFKVMTKGQMAECFMVYREAFRDWNVEHELVLTRVNAPIKQMISFQALRSGEYRPTCTIAILLSIPDGCRIFDQHLDIKHRQVSLREHSTKWPHVLKAMEQQFLPLIRKPLHTVETLRLAEEEADRKRIDNINYTTGLAALNAYVGNAKRAQHWCDQVEERFTNLGREPAEWESRKAQFVRKLRQAIEAGSEQDFLTAPVEPR